MDLNFSTSEASPSAGDVEAETIVGRRESRGGQTRLEG
jgi:hypothetical protein